MPENRRRGLQLRIPEFFWLEHEGRRVRVPVATMSDKEMREAAQQWKDSGGWQRALNAEAAERRRAQQAAAVRRRDFWARQREAKAGRPGVKANIAGQAPGEITCGVDDGKVCEQP